MDDRTLTALRGSIAKWEAIVAGTGEDYGTRNCPLCQAFPGKSCRGCPVMTATGRNYCHETPYQRWERHHSEAHDAGPDIGLTVQCDECRALAQAELDFLRSLLPPETANADGGKE